MSQPTVSILIPNYRTPRLTKLCLRLIRKFTNPEHAQIIVIDNRSEDESVEYLRTLKWIQLIEREPAADDTPSLSHSRALDQALETVDTPYVLVIHTDTMIKHAQWLDFLLQHIERDEKIAGVGSWKLESKSWHRRLLKWIEQYIQLAWYTIIRKKEHALQGVGNNFYYLRSHCALYRTDVLRKLQLSFSQDNETAGKVMHKKLIEAGYKMIFLPSETLGKYIDHINHATMVLNPELSSREKSVTKGNQRIAQSLKKLNAEMILNNPSLDQ